MAEPPVDDSRRIGQDSWLKSCCHCARTFTRTEHLQRHQRIHTREAPFSCPHCHRTFQRSDVKQRHVAKHCKERLLASSDSTVNSSHRTRAACDFCHIKKLKCYGTIPCSACKKADRSCTYLRRKTPSATKTTDNQDWHNSSVQPCLSSDLPPSQSPSSDTTSNLIQNQGRLSANRAGPGIPEIGDTQLAKSLFQSRQDAGVPVPLLSGNIGTAPIIGAESAAQFLSLERSNAYPSSIPSSFEPLCQAVDSILQSENRSNVVQSFPAITSGSEMTYIDSIPGDVCDWDTGVFDDMQGFNANLSDLFPMDYDIFYSEPFATREPLIFNAPFDSGVYASSNNQEFCSGSAQSALSILEEHSRFSRSSSPQSRQEANRWLLTLPSMRKFDRQIINCFLSKFMKHIGPTFCSFTGFKIGESTTSEQILAMAAVGGVFCTTNGSFPVARAMCSDARRLLFAQVDAAVPERKDHQISMVQTYMLVELFGICSGDKRLYECGEAFHMQLLQTASRFHSFKDSISNPDNEITWGRLLTDLNMLECYRVILFQRPPNLYPIPTSALHMPQDPVISSSPSSKETYNPLRNIKALMTPDGPSVPASSASQSLSNLSALLVFSWHAMPLKSTASAEESLWKRSWFELALHRWLKSSQGHIEDQTMLLFHLSSAVLHTNMANIHGLVHKFLLPKPRASIPEALKLWHNSDDCKIAVLHASLLTQAAQRIAISPTSKSFKTPPSLGVQQPPSTAGEGPHAALCVYLAVIILWAAEVTSENTDWANAKSILEKGCNILSQFTVRIAGVLMNVLRRLKENIT